MQIEKKDDYFVFIQTTNYSILIGKEVGENEGKFGYLCSGSDKTYDDLRTMRDEGCWKICKSLDAVMDKLSKKLYADRDDAHSKYLALCDEFMKFKGDAVESAFSPAEIHISDNFRKWLIDLGVKPDSKGDAGKFKLADPQKKYYVWVREYIDAYGLYCEKEEIDDIVSRCNRQYGARNREYDVKVFNIESDRFCLYEMRVDLRMME